jgi:RNA polymerase sigma-70 factor, ECF subfamily
MMNIDPDIQLAADGDPEAFEKVYRCYHRRVYSLCLRMTRNASQAEDLAQDVFIQLLRKIDSFRGESLFATWLYRLTVNQVLMHFRKPAVKTERTAADSIDFDQRAHLRQNPGKMSVLDRISLQEAIDELPPGYRKVFILHDVEGYAHDEIGQMLGCTIGASKSQLHRARQKLQSLLNVRGKTQPRRHSLARRNRIGGGHGVPLVPASLITQTARLGRLD